MTDFKEYVDQLVKHYKGGLYRIITHATHTETKQLLVIYKDNNNEIWARPFEMFWGKVLHDGKIVDRFALIEE